MISDNKKFIYIHYPKAAGSSIVFALSEYSKYELIEKGLKRTYEFTKKNKRIKHASIKDLINWGYVKEENLKNYFIFTSIRNPWERIVSKYSRNPSLSIDYFIKESKVLRDYMEGPDGKFYADYIIRFEHLQEDFDIVCDRLKIPRRDLGYFNRWEHNHYSTYYNDDTRKMVEDKFKEEIEVGKYIFEKEKL